MKAINWIVLAALAALSIMFVALYFMLGFNLVDWPQGLVLGIVWWVAIIAVGVCLQIQKRYFAKKDETGASDIVSIQPENESRANRSGASAASLLITAILVPTLVLCPYLSTNLGFADDAKDGAKAAASSQGAAASSSSKSEKATGTQPVEDAARTAQGQTDSTSSHSNQFMSYYMLSIETTGADVFYSINDSALEQMVPGYDLEASFTDKIEFFVRPQAGYLVSSTFLHSANPNGFVDPDTSGIFSKLGDNEQDGFESAVKSALELGCTKEFHFQNKGTSAITKYKYREFLITSEPFEVTASFDLDGGTLDGASSYVDDNVYYGPDVVGHRLQNIIHIPKTAPEKEASDFKGWKVADDSALFSPGSYAEVQDFWHYLYDNSHEDGAVLPFVAQWESDETTDSPKDTPNDAPADKPSDGSASTPSNTPSDGTSSAPSESPDNSNDGAGSSSSGTVAGGTTDNGDSDGSPGDTDGDAGADNGASNGSDSSSSDNIGNGAVSNTQGTTSLPQESKPDATTADSNESQGKSVDPFAGSEDHGRMLAAQQRTAGSLREGVPFKDAITTTSNALRDGIYTVEDIIVDDPIAQGYGIAFPNRGCWVCDYLKAGILLTLVYGASIIIYRAARRNRKNAFLNSQEPIVGAVSV